MSTEDTKCECTRCSSALSPVGYLVALLRFEEEYYGKSSTYLFEERMHRPYLKDVNVNCDLIEEPVPQIKIAIKELVEYIRKKFDLSTDDEVFEIMKECKNPAPFFYESTRFKEYLKILGTSLEDIHSLFTDPDRGTYLPNLLAELIGISAGELNIIISQNTNITETAEILGIEEVELQESLDNRDKEEMSRILGISNIEMDNLLELSVVGANGDIGNVNLDPEFDMMRRIIAFTRATGVTNNDMVALLKLINPTDISLQEVQTIYTGLKICNVFGQSIQEIVSLINENYDDQGLIDILNLSGQTELNLLKGLSSAVKEKLYDTFEVDAEDIDAILGRLNIQPDDHIDTDKLNEIFRLTVFSKNFEISPKILVPIMADMNPNIDDIKSLGNLMTLWHRIQNINKSGIKIDELIQLRFSLNRTQLTEFLGVSETDLITFVNDVTEDQDDPELAAKLSDILGISIEDLEILYHFGIKDGVIDIDNISKITTLGRLELLHHPVRLTQKMDINLKELNSIKSKNNFVDINTISYDQIIELKESISISRLFGLDITKITELTTSFTEESELMEILEIESWTEYSDLSEEDKLNTFAVKLNVAVEDIQVIVASLDLSEKNDIDKLRRLVGIAQQIGKSPTELLDLINNLPGITSITDVNSYIHAFALAAAPDLINDIISNIAELDDFMAINSYKRVLWIYRISTISNSIFQEKTIDKLSDLNLWEQDIGAEHVTELLLVLEDNFKSQLHKEKIKPNERIWQKSRDALLRYATVNIPRHYTDAPATIEDLSGLLLINLSYSPCNLTTEIQQAIESVQTFIIRARAGQEDDRDENSDQLRRMEEEWRWMRRYVLWEASQKVFIYPENYVMPQLRDNKSPFFNELDEELSQGEVTQALAEKAITSYIDKLQLISALRVSGTVFDSDTSMLYIFARSQINATDTYYRTLKYERIWSPWVKLDMEIKSDNVHPVIAYGRVYIFWIESEGDDESKNYKHKLFYCYEIEKEKWSKPQSIEISRPLSTVKNIGINAWQEDDGINVVVGNLNLAEKGLYYKYYEAPEGTDIDKLPDFDKIIPKRVGTIHNFNISVKDREDNFAIQFDGFISIEQDGEYTFYTKSDDGSQLFIGDFLVVDNDGVHGNITKESYPVMLKKGRYPIRVTYFARKRDNILEVWYKINETIKTISPYRTEAFKLTCSGVFSMLDISWKENSFIRANQIESIYPSGYSVFLRRIGTNGNVEVGYTIFSEGKRWNCKAAYDKNKVTMLFINGSELQFALFDFGRDTKTKPEIGEFSPVYNPELRIHSNILRRNIEYILIDETFRIDDAIVIHGKTYFFCSNQNQSIMIVAKINVDPCGVYQVDFSNCQINYGKQCELANELFQKHIDALHNPNFQNTFEFSGPNKIYNWELFFHIPHFIANGLNQNMKFEAARDWYHYIFNPYSVNSDSSDSAAEWHFKPFKDNIIERLQEYLTNPEEVAVWVEDPYNPHALARIRPGTYQKAIILEYVDNLLDWANQEFTRDTRESLNRALGFYEISGKLLKPEEIEHERPCGLLIKDLKVVIRQAVPGIRVKELLEKLELISNLPAESIEKLSSDIEEISKSLYSEEIRADLIYDILNIAIEVLNNLPEDTLSELINNAEATVDEILVSPEDYINPESEGLSGCFPEEWISPEIQQLPPIWLLTGSTIGCIPENSIFEEYRNRIDSNLRKIRSCRNIAGVQRILPMYEASVDPMSIVKSVSSGAGFGDINFSNAAGIGPYRFGYLIERAKAMANLVAQTGNALLSAIEKKESEELSYLRAQQELNLTKANVHLRKLGVVEAEDYQTLIEKQKERAKIEYEYYKGLLEKKLTIKVNEKYNDVFAINQYEKYVLDELNRSIKYLEDTKFKFELAALSSAANIGLSTGNPFASGSALTTMFSTLASLDSTFASIHSTKSSIYSTKASFKRREEEWKLRRDIANKDKEIGLQNETIAIDRIVIAEMEQQIAEMVSEHADQTLEFLKEKFTNKELYVWMTKILSKLHYGFYNLAYTNAKMAQATLEFERNETLDFISYGYWDSEKKGLLSGDQLLLDINQLDDHYIKNNARKLEITKHISLASMAPEAILALKSNGITSFATPMSWFDRDFPGHYQRIIKSVKVTVIALIGPTSGINATLSTISPSRVVLDPDNPEPPEPVTRIQSVALSSASNATGLFELNYHDERYLPFEGCGVDVSWELEMPKPSNQFDFNSIMDVIMTIDYTALSNSRYKKVVIGELGTDSGGIATLSSRISFPDEWYHFNNPVFLKPRSQGDDPYQDGKSRVPYSMKLAVTRQMFPPNEEEHSIESVALLFSLKDTNNRVPVTFKYSPETGEAFESGPSSTGHDGYLAVPSNIKNKSPFGTWEIFIDRAKAGDLWVIKDDGTPLIENDSYVLDINKINDVLIAITYKAELKWPEEISS